MKNLKKLLLSATTIMMATSAVDPAQAFMLLKSQNQVNNASQQTSQPEVKPEIIPAIQAQISQNFHPSHPALQISPQSQAFNQFLNHESQDAFSFLIQKLAPVFTTLSQNDDNAEETKKLRTQLIEFLQEFNTTRQAPKNIAALQEKPNNNYQILIDEIGTLKEEIKHLQQPKNVAFPQEKDDKNKVLMEEIKELKEAIRHLQEVQVIAEPQAAIPALPEDSIILPREEFEKLNMQISTLTTQVEQLQYSQIDLIDSVSSFKTREDDKTLPAVLHSSALPPMNVTSYNGETPSSVNSEDGSSLPTNQKDTSQQTVLSGVMTALPSDEETSTSSTESSLTDENSEVALLGKPWKKEDFEQNVLGIKPLNLSSMSETETNLWCTFTMLKFTNNYVPNALFALGVSPSSTEQVEKPWSTWGGAFSTTELENKFKSNPFMERAFKDIAALHLTVDAPIFFPEYAQYFLLASPNLNLAPKEDDDLTKAYYFRGLYRALTGDNWTGKTYDSNAAGFTIDLETGLKGSRFNYGSLNSQAPLYESSIYEAEEYFKDTPWHTLFINKVQQATLDALTRENNMIVSSYSKKMSKIIEDENYNTTDIDNLTTEKDLALSITKVMTGGVTRANSLRDIDDALDLL